MYVSVISDKKIYFELNSILTLFVVGMFEELALNLTVYNHGI